MGKVTMTVDGNTAAAYVAYAYTEVAAIYPITPSSPMAETVDEWAAHGQKNIFGETVDVVEMQSEAGASGAFHGALQGGALTTTFTASQGLLLMIPNMYKCSGELLPGVFHVSARSLAANALNIFGDHQDVMAARQTGCVMLASGSVQEVMDLAPVAHLAAIKGRLPFVHFFDGFRTSHEIQKVEGLEYSDYGSLIDQQALCAFRENALSPNHPVTRGTAQNPDIYFQTRECCNPFYDNIVPVVEEYLQKVGNLTGRKYGLFDYYGAEDAESIIIAIGSVNETIEEAVDYLNSKGEKVGVVKVHLYRPFSVSHFMACIPNTVKKIAVLDRTKEPGAIGEPLYVDVCTAFKGQPINPVIVGGRYGLGSKDTDPYEIVKVYDNLKQEQPKNHFTIGIVDDVTNTSLNQKDVSFEQTSDIISCKIWGLGSDGTVGANKQAIKIIGNESDLKVQAYFEYDSKKSGGITISHLRFGKEPIRSTYLVQDANYVACHNQSYVHNYNMVGDLKKNGIFVLNCQWSKEELDQKLPARMKRELAERDANFYIINAVKIAEEIGLGNRINMIMQGAFFKLVNVLPEEVYINSLKSTITKMYGKKGEKVVSMNHEAVDKGVALIEKIEIPKEWATADNKACDCHEEVVEPEFIQKVVRPMEHMRGDSLPVSVFKGREDGTFPNGISAYEKRGIGVNIPEWILENCIQCNQCSYICPHSCIRPFLLDEQEEAGKPDTFGTKKAVGRGLEGLQYRIQVSPMDCTGCGNCADICPAKDKALVMKKLYTQVPAEVQNWAYAVEKVGHKPDKATAHTVKDSQFKQPLMEFSGACAGCGETPYIKLVTQLFGERMMIANATGCSSIWAASAPSTVYTVNREGKGPSWANSLFEDNAEYGYGMYLAVKHMRNKIKQLMEELVAMNIDEKLKELFLDWIQYKEDGKVSKEVSDKVMNYLNEYQCQDEVTKAKIQELFEYKDYFVKRSQWILGGDGWAYDIGFSGLDQVMSSGEDVNILVFDTEIYSNTGGQASKATPTAAIAKFAASGKKCGKKDLGRMMMTYGNVYVAQVGIHADNNQLLKAVEEAESYHGPSLIIAYAPCISHGLKEGMGRSMENIKQAVKCGYWHLYRYNPDLRKEGKNPFKLDSKEPTESFRDFIMKQVRYSALQKQFPEQAEELFARAEIQAQERYDTYKILNDMKFGQE
ncbi:MAG: pyruvate:ferredoxin (flavodoxin) oxidoreductase [bacterium]|nr:pyruvate:ferredoxin (flavodoxin) oxidoreductase [bacterium]